MNITHANYPQPAAYVRLWRAIKALPADAPITHPRLIKAAYANLPTDAVGLTANFVDALHNRINSRGGLKMRGRRWAELYQVDLMRDQLDLHNKVRHRVVVRQWRTDIVRKRYSHLLHKPEDE